jgi:putative MATE family efflux protein
MSTSKRPLLTEGVPAVTLIRLALPMMVGILGMVAFNLVDTFFVGRLGTLPLAAMSFTFPVVFVVASISLGLGVGTSSLVSRAIGRGDQREIRHITTSSLFMSVLLVVVLILISLPYLDSIFRMLGADEETLPLIREYMNIWLAGMPFVVIPMVGNNAIRATGDTKTPAMIMLTAAGINAILDPVFIFGLGPVPFMGLKGAALATVIGRATTLVVSLTVLIRREKMLGFEGLTVRIVLSIWKRLAFVGLPAAGTTMIMPVSVGVVTRLISVYGPAAVAGFGVASRIETFALSFIQAVSAVTVPFVGQNSAAGRFDRSREGIRAGAVVSLTWSVLLTVLVLFLRRPIAGIFTVNPEVMEVTTRYLLIVTASYGFQGILLIVSSAFNGLNRPLRSAALSLTRMFILYIPLALVLRLFFQASGIFAAAAAANLLGGLLAWVWIMRTLKDEEASLSQPE